MTKIFLLALLAMVLYFTVRSMFKPVKRPGKEPEFRKKDDEASTEMAQDPVCGVYVDPLRAVSLRSRGKTYYFCSDKCRSEFEAKMEGD